MRFLYEYRTSDNVLKCGEVKAADRNAAYLLLRSRGIRASHLVEAPGFFNKLFGRGKRWMAICALCALCLVLCLIVCTQTTGRDAQGTLQKAQVAILPRHQIEGLPADWAQHVNAIFTNDIDRLLARYSQPGVIVPADASSRRVVPDAPWVDVLRSVVEGMKGEAAGFMKLGRSVEELERFLDERQSMEANYRAQTVQKVRAGLLTRDAANKLLSAMELPPCSEKSVF